VFVAIVATWPVSAGADQLGVQIPSNCSAHINFDGGADLVDDYRCAGIAIEFHTAGVAFSPGPIWAGQWLFVDEIGQFRVGSCTFNRGIHPTIDAPSSPVAQTFPNDPTGAKGAYLTWRYGDTTDDLTAAAMWAVFHYYAQDGAGTRRASNGAVPLVPSLGMVAQASGRDDIQALAVQLDAEAVRFAGPWAIGVALGADGGIDVRLTAGTQSVAGATVTLLMSGQDLATTVKTDAAGLAHSTMPVAPGTMTVVASTSAPGPALVYRGKPAGPDPNGAQRLVTGGRPGLATATATIDVPIPITTTSSVPSTTTATTTTASLPVTTTSTELTTTTSTTATSTTTTSTPTTSTPTTSTPTTTTAPTVTTTPSAPAEVVPPTVLPETSLPADVPPVDVLPPVPVTALPHTGKGSNAISYLATALLVAGIGIVGVASRRPRRRVIYTR
jgi:hypothetical protein